jgi:photosystem II stability/assembly factor-like uncharacterized protein
MKVAIVFAFISLTLSATAQEFKLQEKAIPEHIHSLCFVDDHGWAISYGSGRLYHTIDQGHSWKLLWETDSTYFEEIYFINHRQGWLTGANGKILYSDDGGISWKSRLPSAWSDKAICYGAYFSNASHGLISGMDRDAGQPRYYCHALIRGQWNHIPQAPQKLLLKIKAGSPGYWIASSSNEIYTIDKKDFLFNTIYKAGSDTLGLIRDVGVVKNLIYAIGSNGYFVSSVNDGKHWTTRKVTDKRIRSILFVNDRTGFIVGDSGMLLVTHDQGEHWEEQVRTTSDLHRIVRSESVIWVCGKDGVLLNASN